MEVVDDLEEAVGRVLLTILADDVDVDRPFPHGKILDGGRLVARDEEMKVRRCCCNRRGACKVNLHDILLGDEPYFPLDLNVSIGATSRGISGKSHGGGDVDGLRCSRIPH